jgi:hypothetical protein
MSCNFEAIEEGTRARLAKPTLAKVTTITLARSRLAAQREPRQLRGYSES